MKILNEIETAALQAALNRTIGSTLKPDGRWGDLTQGAFEEWAGLSSTAAVAAKSTIWPREKDAGAFYGTPGTGHTRIIPPYPLLYEGKAVPAITVHHKIAEAVTRVLTKTLAHYGQDEIHRMGLDRYDGCYNNRNKRGGSSLSMHAYACALDFYAAKNDLRMDRRTALFAKPEYEQWWKFWEDEGAVSLGRARDFDWMHVQLARL